MATQGSGLNHIYTLYHYSLFGYSVSDEFNRAVTGKPLPTGHAEYKAALLSNLNVSSQASVPVPNHVTTTVVTDATTLSPDTDSAKRRRNRGRRRYKRNSGEDSVEKKSGSGKKVTFGEFVPAYSCA